MTFNEASFDREFESKWAGSAEGAFFNIEKFNKYRTIELPDYGPDGRNNKDAYYVLGVDVGRLNCTTEVIVMKVTPSKYGGAPIKRIVNLYSYDEEHFKAQAIKIKRLYRDYKCKIAVIDANGLGVGLVDELVMDQTDPDSGELLPALGVYNDEDGKYKKYADENPNTIKNAIYLMKANISINTDLYAYCQNQMSSGKLRFLIDEDQAKLKLISQSKGQKMNQSKRAEYLRPYVMTSILRDQMANLVQENEGANIILKQSTKTIKKDKFSALIYALFWPKLEEESKRKKKIDPSKLTMFTPATRVGQKY